MPQSVVLPLAEGREGAMVRVHPLLTGEILAPPLFFKRLDGPLGLLEGLGLHIPPRRWRWCPIPAFLVEHPTAGALLIDTGLDASVVRDPGEQLGPWLKRLFRLRVAAGQDVVSQARARGVEPGAIRTVILTHLHYDHAGAAGQLPHATLLFDGREWAPAPGSAVGGLPARDGRPPVELARLGLRRRPVRHRLQPHARPARRRVDTSGLHPRSLPRHLSVLLRTATGPVLVVGDAAYTRRAIVEGHDQIVRADPAAYRISLQSLRRWTDEHPAAPIICSHDYEFWADAPSLHA